MLKFLSTSSMKSRLIQFEALYIEIRKNYWVNINRMFIYSIVIVINANSDGKKELAQLNFKIKVLGQTETGERTIFLQPFALL